MTEFYFNSIFFNISYYLYNNNGSNRSYSSFRKIFRNHFHPNRIVRILATRSTSSTKDESRQTPELETRLVSAYRDQKVADGYRVGCPQGCVGADQPQGTAFPHLPWMAGPWALGHAHASNIVHFPEPQFPLVHNERNTGGRWNLSD